MQLIFLSSLFFNFHTICLHDACMSSCVMLSYHRNWAFVSPLKVFHRSFVIPRFVEPIDQSGYKQWSAARSDSEQLDQRTLSHLDSGVSGCQTAETSETETPQLSFAEVMRLVQEGKEVPGVTKVDVKPTNDDPTPSTMERRLKPWEVSASKWHWTFYTNSELIGF